MNSKLIRCAICAGSILRGIQEITLIYTNSLSYSEKRFIQFTENVIEPFLNVPSLFLPAPGRLNKNIDGGDMVDKMQFIFKYKRFQCFTKLFISKHEKASIHPTQCCLRGVRENSQPLLHQAWLIYMSHHHCT